MIQEKRRAERIDIQMPVTVLLWDDETGKALAGPAPGEAKNFSPTGLALTLANIMIDKYHLFFTCQDNPSRILKIGFTLSGDPETTVEVPARPVWYDLVKETADERRAMMGVQFLLNPKDKAIKKLVNEFSRTGKAPTSWWQIKIF